MTFDYANKIPLISMNNIKKEFSGVWALSGISFDVFPGEVHCLVGENGAGKSTLMKILSGAYTPTEGSIEVDGAEYQKLDPELSKQLGINVVYQENDLVPSMDVVENIYVGNEITKAFNLIDYKAMESATIQQMNELGINLKLHTKIEDLSVSDQQFVKILKALSVQPRLLIMDEPTSMFNVADAAKVLNLTKRITAKGIGIIYISHFLNEVIQIADRITVIRDGSVVRTYLNDNRDTPITDITRDMVGRPIEMFYDKEKCEIGNVMLEVCNLQLTKNSPKINFSVRKGEILGFSGMVGSGRTEIMRALTGADSRYAGQIRIHGKEVVINNPNDSINAGIAFITEDRQRLGLMLHSSVLENTIILGLREKISGFFVNIRRLSNVIQPLIRDLRIKMPSIWTEAVYLSGGNQQKVVLAKWLFADQEIYIFDEPTRGIDINAKTEFYKHMSALTKQGKCIIMISSDMPELISMSDRVLVVRDGAIACELCGEDINEQELIKRALGVKNDAG